MYSSEKAGYVEQARRIKDDFHAAHPDVKCRSSRKSTGRKRKLGSPNPPLDGSSSLDALAMLGASLATTEHGIGSSPVSPAILSRLGSIGGTSTRDAEVEAKSERDSIGESHAEPPSEPYAEGRAEYPIVEAPAPPESPSSDHAAHAAAAHALSSLFAC